MLIRAQYHNVQAMLNGITTTTTNTMTIVQSIHSSSTPIDNFNLSSNEFSEQSAMITTSSCNNNKTQTSRDRKAIMWRYWTPFGTIAWRSAQSVMSTDSGMLSMFREMDTKISTVCMFCRILVVGFRTFIL